MSLNKYEQRLLDYLGQNPEELRHWQARVAEVVRGGDAGDPGRSARTLERELWDYFVERSAHVGRLRELHAGGLRRVSLQNLSEHLLRLFGPPVRPREASRPEQG
jgi:hypothetical protein